jgi:hypothetical protein
MKRLDLIFVVRMNYNDSHRLNKTLFNHYKDSVLNILELGLTYNISIHFIDFLGLHYMRKNTLEDTIYTNELITFNNINYVNKDINSLENLYLYLSKNIKKIIYLDKYIVYFNGKGIKLDLIGLLQDPKIIYKGYDFEGIVID